jgi:hypothetical protein
MRFNFSVGAAALIMAVTALGSLVQLPGVGGGFQACFIFALATFFLVPIEKATAASLVAWVFSNAPTVAVAGVYMLAEGETFRSLKSAIRNPESQTV